MKCIVSDFDGTLYDDNINSNILKIKEFVNNGNIFVLATGRTYNSIKSAISSYNIPYSYLICSDGTVIYDKNDNIIYEKILDNDIKKNIVSNILKITNQVQIKYDNNYDISDNDEKAGRILVNANDSVKKILLEELNMQDNIYAYLSTNWLNIYDIKSDKTVAITYLEKLINIDKKDIYVIGNDINDYAMIKYYNGYLIGSNVEFKCFNSFDEFINKINTI